VSATHRVATEAFTVPMLPSIKDEASSSPSLHSKTFPAGTVILIPMSLAMLDESFWGPTAYDYDASRPNLCPFSMIFNSVGDRSNGRICPGKDLAMNLVVDLLRVLGEVRRSKSSSDSTVASTATAATV
jgi:cytochrome P450